MKQNEKLVSDEIQNRLVDLQLTMATSSINHEYARMEFDSSKDIEKREELLAYMNECHNHYVKARSTLSTFDPCALESFEADLVRQKHMMFSNAAVS